MGKLRGYSDNEIIKRMESGIVAGFNGWKPGAVCDIWIRKAKKASEVDIFADKVATYVVNSEGRPEFRMICSGTSITGSWALKNFKTYNPKGAAVLAGNHFVENSHAPGLHKGYAAYRQVKAFPMYRDKDFDLVAEENGELITNEIIAANCHRAKRNGLSQIIYNWSAACLVRNSDHQFQGWLAYMSKRPLSLGILKEF